ncbi:unnamed protein product [Rotaria magnacalcarata]|uniref:PPM-type phosphatase domain-containing protein n=3 Tax=Rotaria magnacalcarata TaxID=392030 RepID=A0A814XGZ9_9BILA|nr:unnamed protein product [Rotaria magnacalcarata]CAF1546731.1 unnamed protein product [Rotaria magnacalcarata]CAF2124483.1 unnamed protein product [Rotaria magnacalcarata]CAF3763471.1 unnamed protein product [Rotaria magnacalcarata]CAF3858120.1 unnamed protein product [Rotaria magnacalcarata]
MATGTTAMASSIITPANASNLSNFIPCPHTFVATKVRQNRTHYGSFTDNRQQTVVPRVCRLRRNDNTMGIYALVDPIDTNMIASDVCVNMLVEQLSQVSFDDDSYKKKISDGMQQIFYETENRLLQMVFDRAEEKAISGSSGDGTTEKCLPSSGDGTTEKCLPSLDEAQSGAFLFAATVTQSKVYIAYVGTIRMFLISNNNGDLQVSNNRPQYYHTGSLHTIHNEDESLRLKKLNVNLAQVQNEGLDNNHSKYTRCIGKLTEKLLSSAAAANDVNEARCNALVCEPRFEKFNICPQDYALVMMTDKLYQMYLKTGISEDKIPSNFVDLLGKVLDSVNPAQRILNELQEQYQRKIDSTDDESHFQEMGLLIHFFYHAKTSNQSSPFSVTRNATSILVEGEIAIDEVKNSIMKNNEIQEKREKNRTLSRSHGHIREKQTHNKTVEPFVRFNDYELLLNEKEELREADNFITDLLYSQSASGMDEKLTEYLKLHSSLKL